MDGLRRLTTIAATVAAGVSLIAVSTAGAAGRRPEDGAEPPNFASVCRFSHRAGDDPIVAPGKPGGSHSHDFVGNTSTSAGSTYRSLRAAGTTCGRPGDRAAYWAPTVYDGATALAPRVAKVYYLPATRDLASIQAPPAGLEVVAGDSKATSAQPMSVTRWTCVNGMAEAESSPTPPTCAEGSELVLVVRFPDCWNGRQLDSADHKSHLAYSSRGGCPRSHPKKLPAIALHLHYPTRGGASIRLSSGSAYTAHADFFNAWDQRELERLVRECLNRGVHCGARGPERA